MGIGIRGDGDERRRLVGNDGFAFGVGAQGQNSLLQIGFGSSNNFVCDFGGNAVQTPAYSDTNWHHWACTYDAVSRQRKIYRDGVLQPQETKTLYGTVSVAANAATGLYELTQAAEASIQDRREQSGFAEAWLKFDEGAGTTTYADYSGVVPARTATCSSTACPTAGAAGIVGNAATFDGANDLLAISPAAIVGQSTVAAWVRPNHQSNTIVVLGSRGPTDYGFEMKFMGAISSLRRSVMVCGG